MEWRGTFVPHLNNFLVLVEPLLHLSREGEEKQAEPDALRCDILDDDSVAQLEEVLEMCVRILTGQTTEWVCLHHHDETSPNLEVSVARVNSRANGHIGNGRIRELAE